MTESLSRQQQRAATAGCLLVAAAAALILASAANLPLPSLAAATAFVVLAFARPRDAAVVTMALAGFGIIISHLAGLPPFRVSEFLVVACVGGCTLRAAVADRELKRALAGALTLPVLLFAVTVLASFAVELRVHQLRTAEPHAFATAFLRFLWHDYFVSYGELAETISTATVLEGLAVYVMLAAYCRIDGTFFDRSLRMLAVGGAGLGVMSVVRLAEIVVRNPHALDVMRATDAGLRISPQIPDYIAAGSYFSLCWLVSLGVALASRRARFAWIGVSLLLLAAMYLTGSRSVLAAGAAGLAVTIGALIWKRRAVAGRLVVAVAIATLVLVGVTFPKMIGHGVAGENARASLNIRAELFKTAIRVIQERPIFGVGVDHFYIAAGGLASPELNRLWPGRKNAHNDFLRIAAELGLVGLGLFVGILAGALRALWRTFAREFDVQLTALLGGLLAFGVTMLVSNPLIVQTVSYFFWIALGLAVGPAAPGQSDSDAVGHKHLRHRQLLGFTAAGLLLVSVPFRAIREVEAANLTRVSYGVSDWNTDADRTPWRYSGAHAALFVDASASFVEIPMRGTLPSGAVQLVEVRLDGRLANTVAVGTEWKRVGLVLPAVRVTTARRIDLSVSPTWTPPEGLPGADRMREVGIKLGEITITRPK